MASLLICMTCLGQKSMVNICKHGRHSNKLCIPPCSQHLTRYQPSRKEMQMCTTSYYIYILIGLGINEPPRRHLPPSSVQTPVRESNVLRKACGQRLFGANGKADTFAGVRFGSVKSLENTLFQLADESSMSGWWFGSHVLFSQKYWVSNHPN